MQYILSVRTLILGVLAVTGALVANVVMQEQAPAWIRISPNLATVAMGDTLSFDVVVHSDLPANAFSGEIDFDAAQFVVEKIDYNTSIANLWVEEPWYNRSNNSIYFAGGTTQPGGFTGTGSLLTVTLRARTTGDATLRLRNTRIMAHDGLGSDIDHQRPIDAIFTIDTTPYQLSIEQSDEKFVTVVPLQPPLDINGDGNIGFQDISVLLLQFGSTNPVYDFTGDGTVSWADIRAWQQLREKTAD